MVVLGAVVAGVVVATSGSGVAVSDLKVGDCFDHQANWEGPEEDVEPEKVTGVPCDEPHQFEVFHSFEYPGEVYPGDDQADQIAYDECLPAFRDFVGVAYGATDLAMSYFRPGDDSWDDHAAGFCYVADLSEETTGSLEDAGL